ncbi:hypothetical protein [Abyssibacter profundi]|uniref:hypothetical protein n=1 Tax=Abyssibacter profundi TaxID=2182787 RepID=UPI001057BD85|nr:hypothetical protein [Abyssibacter profundi]
MPTKAFGGKRNGRLDRESYGWTLVQKLEFLLERESIFLFWNTVIYVMFRAVLVVLAVVLHRSLQPHAPLLTSIATPFGLIWVGSVVAIGVHLMRTRALSPVG